MHLEGLFVVQSVCAELRPASTFWVWNWSKRLHAILVPRCHGLFSRTAHPHESRHQSYSPLIHPCGSSETLCGQSVSFRVSLVPRQCPLLSRFRWSMGQHPHQRVLGARSHDCRKAWWFLHALSLCIDEVTVWWSRLAQQINPSYRQKLSPKKTAHASAWSLICGQMPIRRSSPIVFSSQFIHVSCGTDWTLGRCSGHRGRLLPFRCPGRVATSQNPSWTPCCRKKDVYAHVHAYTNTCKSRCVDICSYVHIDI